MYECLLVRAKRVCAHIQEAMCSCVCPMFYQARPCIALCLWLLLSQSNAVHDPLVYHSCCGVFSRALLRTKVFISFNQGLCSAEILLVFYQGGHRFLMYSAILEVCSWSHVCQKELRYLRLSGWYAQGHIADYYYYYYYFTCDQYYFYYWHPPSLLLLLQYFS